jgi:hypothetical protein
MKRRKVGDIVKIENVVAWRDRFTIPGREGVWELPRPDPDQSQHLQDRVVLAVEQGTTNTQLFPWGTEVVIHSMFDKD